ncbi:hypothetical protein BDQ17DRAFT_1364107 [Cyathus striatus]|nr:hypothetical protein BDQ17DRAFT_1364107 [Cyathus striatus]
MSKVKMTYISSRYLGLLFQLASYLILELPLSHLPIAPRSCLRWYIFQAVGFYSLYEPLSAISMLRVYAMYNKSKVVGTFLSALWLTEAFLSVISCIRVLMLMEFDAICYGTIAPGALWLFGAVVTLSQLTTLMMTTAKRSAGVNAVDFRIVGTVLRDGIWMFAVTAAIVASAVPYAFAKQVVRPYIAFTWPISLMSFTTCRLIMNMQRISVDVIEHVDDPALKYIGRSLNSIELPPFLTEGNRDINA